MHRLQGLLAQNAPQSTDVNIKLKSYKAVSGLEKRFIQLLIGLNQYHAGISYATDLSGNELCLLYSNFFMDPLMPDKLNVYLLRKLYVLKLLAADRKSVV